jgi:DNA-binding response OmpR family regulator
VSASELPSGTELAFHEERNNGRGNALKDGFTILIADRNPHVRDFLRREMISEGYRVRLARNGQEVLKSVLDDEPLDLLILDLDLPDVSDMTLLQRVQERIPTLPIVIHTFFTEDVNHPSVLCTAALVEKDGTNIESLKKAVMDALQKTPSQHTQAGKNQ